MVLPAQAAFTLSFLIGIIPAMVILFYTVKNYEGYFEDRHFFFALMVSLFISILAGFFHIAVMVTLPGIFDLIGLIVVIFALATFETVAKVVFVNLPRFKREYDTTFYGASFGCGFASFIVIAIGYVTLLGKLGGSIEFILSLVLFALGVVFIQGAMGIYIGYGCHKLDLFGYSLKAIFIQAPFNFVVVLWYVVIYTAPLTSGWELILIATIYAFGVYLYVYFKILPLSLPEDLRKHRRRTLRRYKMK
ncbi:MAG: hypothetical protein KAJ51_11730 [Thermoplasmata archaeon]|nr:hypothetical protein [Thermoplasmata archaeon]